MRKKGQFYVFDAFFAALILFVGIGFLVMEYTAVPLEGQTRAIAFDVSDRLSGNFIENIFTDYTVENFDILNPGLTPAQQIQVWWRNDTLNDCDWCMSNATALATSLITTLDVQRHGINVTIKNDTNQSTVYHRPLDREAQYLIVNQQIVMTGTQGPDTLEVRVWR